MSQIDCRIEQSTGRITLRRPEALNALTMRCVRDWKWPNGLEE